MLYEAKQKVREEYKIQFELLRDKIEQGIIIIDDETTYSNWGFYENFKDIIPILIKYRTIELNKLNLLYRGVSDKCIRAYIENNDIDSIVSRFTPNVEIQQQYKIDNRMNDRNKPYIYLSTADRDIDAKNTITKELRKKNMDSIYFAKYKINKKYKNYGVVNLTFEKYEILQYMYLEETICSQYTNNEKNNNDMLEKYLACYYFFLYTSNFVGLFNPIEKNKDIDLAIEYAPYRFLCNLIEHYGKQKNIVGIIFPSTVCNSGSNLAFFDTKYLNFNKDDFKKNYFKSNL